MRKSLSISILLLLTCFLFAQNEDLNTRFLQAVKEGNVQEVELLLKRGADINCLDSTGQSALHISVRDNKIEIVNLLLNTRAKVDILDSIGRTPLMYAAYNGYLRVCHSLILKNSNLVIKDMCLYS